MRKLPRKFYSRPTIEVAIDLLGCRIISNTNGVRTGGMIVETEAYIGEDDPACHAFHGLTKRTKIMYGPPGHLYVYFTYGNHFMVNVVTEEPGFPSAVLLRAFQPEYGIPRMAKRRNTASLENIASGPGKLAAALGISSRENGLDLSNGSVRIIGPGTGKQKIAASPRIGIGNLGTENLWRFFLIDNPHVSKSSKAIRENTLALARAARIDFSL